MSTAHGVIGARGATAQPPAAVARRSVRGWGGNGGGAVWMVFLKVLRDFLRGFSRFRLVWVV